MIVENLDRVQAQEHVATLTQMLCEAVEDGALVGYVLPLKPWVAEAYWHGVISSVDAGERLLLCALADGALVGTVQLYLSPEPNAPHRGEIYKLLVRRSHQRHGIGEALMRAVEQAARHRGRTLLLLDTVEGGAGERLYRRLGWREIGVVPNHFVDPTGHPKTSIYFMLALK
ncbi:GNAT family N-acetyltransferase [Rhizobium sp.]